MVDWVDTCGEVRTDVGSKTWGSGRRVEQNRDKLGRRKDWIEL